MATTKPLHDPVKTLEGMFNGSVTRIAYVLKDPTNFGQGTKAILAETAKKFQDALDDCEIQILEAKWYLEHQLSLNKAKREARAKEESAISAKRKHDDMKESEAVDQEVSENLAKRVKTEDAINAQVKQETSVLDVSDPEPKQDVKTEQNKIEQPTTEAQSEDTQDQSKPPEAHEEIEYPENTQNVNTQNSVQPSIEDGFAKGLPQETPIETNDDFNFVSMFGEPTAEGVEGGENGIPFDLNLGDEFSTNMNDTTTTLQNQDPMEALNTTTDLQQQPSQPLDSAFNATNTTDNPSAGTANNFDLANLGPNDFDAFLNDNDFGDPNLDSNMNLTEEAMMDMENLDFDSMFN